MREEAERLFGECARLGRFPIAIFDAALLVETGAYRTFDRLIVVRASAEVQRSRLLERCVVAHFRSNPIGHWTVSRRVRRTGTTRGVAPA